MNNVAAVLGKVQDLTDQLQNRITPIIHQQAKVSDIVAAFANAPHSRIVYVVDNNEVLQGVITLGRIVRHVLVHYHDSSLDKKSLFSLAIAEKAEDFMQPESIRIDPQDDLETVLGEMIEHDVAELPVVDAEGKIIEDITIIDIISYYHKIKGSRYLDTHNHNDNHNDNSSG